MLQEEANQLSHYARQGNTPHVHVDVANVGCAEMMGLECIDTNSECCML